MPLPEWVTPGAPAVILRTPTHVTPSVERVTVKNVATKSFTTHSDRSGGTVRWTIPRYGESITRSLGTWSGTERVLQPTDPLVTDALKVIRSATSASRAYSAFRAWEQDRASEDATGKLITAVNAAHDAAVEADRG